MWKVLTHGKASLLKIFNNIKHINWRPKSAGHPFPAKSTLFLKNWVIHTFPQNLTYVCQNYIVSPSSIAHMFVLKNTSKLESATG